MGIRPTFGLVDYCVFGATLLLSLLIGVYHAVRGKQTNEDLLLGGRSMSILPVAVSIMVSFLSAILILGEGHGPTGLTTRIDIFSNKSKS